MRTTPPPPPAPSHPMGKWPSYLHLSDIQGLAQLATQGTLGVAELAEQVQGHVYKAVAAPFGAAGQKFVDPAAGSSGVKKNGITGLVYGSVKGVTRLVGGAVDTVLSHVVPRVGPQASSPQREAVLSALNGVLGDQLRDTANPLAIRMSVRHQGRSLPMEKTALAQDLPAATTKLLVLVHGLCMNDLQWRSDHPAGAHDHGEALARALGYTTVYLHYNTGLHTSDNGQQLAALLEQLWQAWPLPVQELTLLTHSMGGLVARSACQHGEQAEHRWRKGLRHLVFLGTPHHGAPLESLGSWVDTLLGSSAVTRPFAKIGQIRSSGITDLRYGYVLASSWQDTDRFERAPDTREPLPLPEDVACFTVAASLSDQAGDLKDQWIGDGLVPVPSALGQHDDVQHRLAFAPDKQWVAQGMNHMELLSRPEVTRQLVGWLSK
ncbi:alpha/beta hydrolase [Polaromonas sp. SM01]|uniref:esterase/lipase family protein n=1 Tax=Polaromonas sp. SM01 TaxID=3085630 RepID=UPI0029812A2F|nr:alpha/beta hydrolase [Polaromonas sp. SM01]MDW5442466.1 alpha/beta hydrolase [Polaromonas sp. SM01]